MKYSWPTLLLCLALTACMQRGLKILKIEDRGAELSYRYEELIDTVSINGLNIKVLPISGDSINPLINREKGFDGRFNYINFERSSKAYFLSSKPEPKTRSTSTSELLLNAIDDLLRNKKISESEHFELEQNIISSYYPEQSLSLEPEHWPDANPYYIDNRYLSVFQIELVNTTEEAIPFRSAPFVIYDRNVVPAYTVNEIAELLKNNPNREAETSIVLKRYHLPGELIIPPQKRIVKYFAVPPIVPRNEMLEIAFMDIKETLAWKVMKTERLIADQHIFYTLKLDVELNGSTMTEGNKVISVANMKDIYVVGNDLYVKSNRVEAFFDLLTITYNYGSIYFARTRIKPSLYIDLKQKKSKRVPITLNKL